MDQYYDFNISIIGGRISMISSSVIYLMDNWRGKNIFEIIHCQGQMITVYQEMYIDIWECFIKTV